MVKIGLISCVVFLQVMQQSVRMAAVLYPCIKIKVPHCTNNNAVFLQPFIASPSSCGGGFMENSLGSFIVNEGFISDLCFVHSERFQLSLLNIVTITGVGRAELI